MGEVSGKALVADYRLATVQPSPRHTLASERKVVCAEPSPDVVRAFSSALSTSFSADISKALAAGDSKAVEALASLQYQNSQAIAQLGKRYATVQILRDILHAQCQQFANGTMSESTWAALQSQFNTTVITLLSIEMVGGDTAAGPVTTVSVTPIDGQLTVQQFVKTGGAINDATAKNEEFKTANAKVSAAAQSAQGDDAKNLTAATKAFDAVGAMYSKVVASMQAVWKDINTTAGVPSAEAKTKIADIAKQVPAQDDATIAAATKAAAAAPTAEVKATTAAMGVLSKSVGEASKQLTVLAGAKTISTEANAGDKGEKPADQRMDAVQQNAITLMQERFLLNSGLAPSVLACFTYFDPPAGNTVGTNDILKEYCKAVFKQRVAQAEKLSENAPRGVNPIGYLSKPGVVVNLQKLFD